MAANRIKRAGYGRDQQKHGHPAKQIAAQRVRGERLKEVMIVRRREEPDVNHRSEKHGSHRFVIKWLRPPGDHIRKYKRQRKTNDRERRRQDTPQPGGPSCQAREMKPDKQARAPMHDDNMAHAGANSHLLLYGLGGNLFRISATPIFFPH